jgi:hypothetical protein
MRQNTYRAEARKQVAELAAELVLAQLFREVLDVHRLAGALKLGGHLVLADETSFWEIGEMETQAS